MNEDVKPPYPSTPQWTEGSQQFLSGSYDLEVTKLLQDTYNVQIPEAIRQDPESFPPVFVEIGGGIHPFVTDTVASVSTFTQPEVFLFDPGYTQDFDAEVVRNQLLVARFPALKGTLPANQTDLEKGKITTFAETNNLHVRADAIPNITVPKNISGYHLVFTSVANYVDAADLQTLISDPRVKTVGFVNSIYAGEAHFAHLMHPNRVKSSSEISRMCENASLLQLAQYEVRDDNPAHEPSIGQLYTRTPVPSPNVK